MTTMAINSSPQFVVKVSKYCNLRCDYCYEFPHLGNSARINLDQIRAGFQNIKNSIDDLSIENVDFIWHGGEPLLIPLEFYERVNSSRKTCLGRN